MADDRLTPLQRRLIHLLAGGEAPVLTLSGGAALAGVHTRHRSTRDLDLFLQKSARLGDVPGEVRRRIDAAGLQATPMETAEAFVRLAVRDGEEVVQVDLVADPVPLAEEPLVVDMDGVPVRVDTAHQILVNKLCALLSRSELRDLWDVQELLARGGDLERALVDAAAQDAGFSPLTFAWVLQELPVARLARALSWSDALIATVDGFRTELMERVLRKSVPK